MNIGWFVDTIRKVEITHLDSTDQSEIGYFLRYFTSKLNYPAEAIENGYSGTVYTEFNIDSSGHLVNVRILRKVYPALDNLVIKILEECPPFNPKKKDLILSYVLPVKFRIIP